MCYRGEDCQYAHPEDVLRVYKEKLEDYLVRSDKNLADYSFKGQPLAKREIV